MCVCVSVTYVLPRFFGANSNILPIDSTILIFLFVLNSFFGGNSTKATSGMNGAGTQTQIKQGVPDNAQIFYEGG